MAAAAATVSKVNRTTWRVRFRETGCALLPLRLFLGLWTRIAALRGMALAFTFLLTVSCGTRPYFYGPDIIYLLAYTPFVLAGDGGVLSWGAVLRRGARLDLRLPATPLGPESAAILHEVDRRTLLRTGG